jgi:voltage-gated sodium channel
MNIFAQNIIKTNTFNAVILSLIVLNGLFIGIQTYDWAPDWLHYVQLVILFVFMIEVILRWYGRKSTKEYFKDGWNYFDVTIVVLGVIPEVADIIFAHQEGEGQSSVWATLRVLRIIQLSRSVRAVRDLRVLIMVLVKSIRSLSYIGILFLLIMYVYAIIGVTLFKNHEYDSSEHLRLTGSNPDPYGDIGEAFFTLFRILTGEDWTDLRYNMLDNEYTTKDGKNVVATGVPNWVKTLYHVSWMVIAAYLLMNLVIGAIVSNFQMVLDSQKTEDADELAQQALDNPEGLT